jgi:hypothetical protein
VGTLEANLLGKALEACEGDVDDDVDVGGVVTGVNNDW